MGSLVLHRTDVLPMSLTVDRNGGVSGLSPTVAIRTESGDYLDWDDLDFKSSGWTTKYQLMADKGGGHYEMSLALNTVGPVSNPAATPYLICEYFVDDGGLIKGMDADTVTFLPSLNRISLDTHNTWLAIQNTLQPHIVLLRKHITNRIHEASGNPGTMVLYDDDDSTPILTWELLDETGGVIVPAIGSPARRAKAT